ncbi:MAG: hypothetical protein L3J97_07330, partial [Thermoplasmata archaeon]|nr:hypothetical protein [Thermoplasmata archaeon]
MSTATGAGEGAGTATTEARGAEILAGLRAQKLRWVEIFYTDILGGFNHLHIPVDALEPDSFVTG